MRVATLISLLQRKSQRHVGGRSLFFSSLCAGGVKFAKVFVKAVNVALIYSTLGKKIFFFLASSLKTNEPMSSVKNK